MTNHREVEKLDAWLLPISEALLHHLFLGFTRWISPLAAPEIAQTFLGKQVYTAVGTSMLSPFMSVGALNSLLACLGRSLGWTSKGPGPRASMH